MAVLHTTVCQKVAMRPLLSAFDICGVGLPPPPTENNNARQLKICFYQKNKKHQYYTKYIANSKINFKNKKGIIYGYCMQKI